jgi:5-methylcytosine-specific restriction enzyme A
MGSMNCAYLFAWNSKPEMFDDYIDCIEEFEKTGKCILGWRCNTKKIRPGDRIFLIKIGKHPKGIIGSGIALTDPADGGIEIELDTLLNSDKHILNITYLQKGPLSKQNWTPQVNGVSIRSGLVQKLEEKWSDFLRIQEKVYSLPTSITYTQETYLEGAANQVLQTRYERNPQARAECLKHYGFSCSVCDFNFEKHYGKLGKSFIHVHHLEPIAMIGKEYKINPVEDLRPVCPNCHAMLHKRTPQLTIEELKELLIKRG